MLFCHTLFEDCILAHDICLASYFCIYRSLFLVCNFPENDIYVRGLKKTRTLPKRNRRKEELNQVFLRMRNELTAFDANSKKKKK